MFEMLGDPAEPERKAGAEDQGGVDVRRGGHDALVEQVTDLVCDRGQRALEDLVLRERALLDDRDLLATLAVVRQCPGKREAVGIGIVQRLEYVQGDAR